VREWLETAMGRRGVREGAFIVLFGGEAEGVRLTFPQKDVFLRALARRAGMDYLTGAPNALPGGLPDSLDSFSRRAEEHSTIIENMLRQPPPPGVLF
jgi:hypothetical protein